RFAVHKRTDAQRMRVDFSGGGDPGPERRVRVEGFAKGPLRGSLLPIAHAHIVSHTEAEYCFASARTRHVAAALSDDDNKLGFVVQLLRDRGEFDGIERPVYRGGHLGEKGGENRPLRARLLDVIEIVQTYRENFSRPQHGSTQPDGGKRLIGTASQRLRK